MQNTNSTDTHDKYVKSHLLSGKAKVIADVIERRMIIGEYKAGEKVSLDALTKQFDASRQPVAAAANYLGSIGFIEIIPQVGCKVVSLSWQEVGDFYRMYGKIEAAIAGLAAERYQNDDGQRLIDLAKNIASMPFQTSEHRLTYSDKAITFLELFGKMSKSPRMVYRVNGLRQIARFYLLQRNQVDTPSQMVKDHLNLLRSKLAAAIKARKAKQAERLAEAYILAHTTP